MNINESSHAIRRSRKRTLRPIFYTWIVIGNYWVIGNLIFRIYIFDKINKSIMIRWRITFYRKFYMERSIPRSWVYPSQRYFFIELPVKDVSIGSYKPFTTVFRFIDISNISLILKNTYTVFRTRAIFVAIPLKDKRAIDVSIGRV